MTMNSIHCCLLELLRWTPLELLQDWVLDQPLILKPHLENSGGTSRSIAFCFTQALFNLESGLRM